jgi:hypothetical protein
MTEPAYHGFLADDSLPDWVGLVALAKLVAPEIPDGTVYHLAENEPDPPAFQIVAKLRADILGGALKAELRTFHAYGDPAEPLVTEWFIHRDDARQYFKALRWQPPEHSPLWKWLNGGAATPADNAEQDTARDDWRNDPELLKSDKQARAIAETIKAKGFNPLVVPDGEKGPIEALCTLEYPELFTAATAFETTWKRGLKAGYWRMQSHASYAKRGKD